MVDSDDRLVDRLALADQALDCAWQQGEGIEAALEAAKRLSVLVGRDPVIEDAKLVIAAERCCLPSEAWVVLRELSQRTNRRLAEIAHEVVEGEIAPWGGGATVPAHAASGA